MTKRFLSANLLKFPGGPPALPTTPFGQPAGLAQPQAFVTPLVRSSWPRQALRAAGALLLPLLLAAPVRAQVAATAADAFVESIGVNTHWEYGTYADYDGLKAKLGASGIRYVRDGSSPNIQGKLNDLYSTYGIRTNVLLGRRFAGDWPKPLDPGQIDAELRDVKNIAPGVVATLEDPNEYDISHGDQESDWVGKIKTYTQTVHTKAKADGALKNFPILGPSFTNQNAPFYDSYQRVGSLDAWIDYANIHPYQSDRHPGVWGWGSDGYGSIDWVYKYMISKQSPAGKPAQATECGYSNSLGQDGLSEEAEGKYTARMYAEFYRRGFSRTFKYELLNETAWHGNDREGQLGLLRADLSEKPAFRAVKNLISVLSDKGASFTPGALAYTLTGYTDNVRHMLFQKRNGDFYLMLWLEVPSWDADANKDLYPAAQNVVLNLPGSITGATKYELNNNSDLTTVAVPINNGLSALSVFDRVMIVKLAAGNTTTTPTTPDFSGVYRLVARHSGKVLDVSGGSQADGAAVHQWENFNIANQRWTVQATGNGYYKLTAQHSGKCLDVSEASTADGAKVQQYTDNGNAAQRWKIEPTSDGYFKLTAQCSGKVLDVQGGPTATANGAPVKQYIYGGGLNQQWKMEAVTGPANTTLLAATSAARSETELTAYPNPSQGQPTLRFRAARAQSVQVSIYNPLGQAVQTFKVAAQAGTTDYALPRPLLTGLYQLRATVDGRALSCALQVE